MSESSDYQRLRAHLSFLRMSAAAEALPAELDHARTAGLTHQGFLERLLAVEVAAVDERRHSSLARFASVVAGLEADQAVLAHRWLGCLCVVLRSTAPTAALDPHASAHRPPRHRAS